MDGTGTVTPFLRMFRIAVHNIALCGTIRSSPVHVKCACRFSITWSRHMHECWMLVETAMFSGDLMNPYSNCKDIRAVVHNTQDPCMVYRPTFG